MLPVPNLDDRRFQDLVDEAKRFVQQRCPEWSDHNVHDPGVTVIETFAWMTDLLLYRLNRVPERIHIALLDLLGVQLLPAAAARTPVTFWLSAPRNDAVVVPEGARVGTAPTADEEPLEFSIVERLKIPPVEVVHVAAGAAGGGADPRTDLLVAKVGFTCFGDPPVVGDHLLIGLSDPVPRCVVLLRFQCEITGMGVNPSNPPLTWEAWCGDGWVACEVDREDTGGLNRPGEVVLHVPQGHTGSVVAGLHAGWLRCRYVEPEPDQPGYRTSPRITALSAGTIGGSVDAVHARIVLDEVIGTSEGVPGQRFALMERPVVPSDSGVVVEVGGAGSDGWEAWEAVASFGQSESGARHFRLDAATGEIVLGPAVRLPDGSLRTYGAVPQKGAVLRVNSYWSGGGARGNVATGALNVLRSTVPYITRVENRLPAQGGVDGETLDNAMIRGPLALRARDRAVTVEDHASLAREIAPDAGRVHALAVDGGVRVLVVPAIREDPDAALEFRQLVPTPELLQRIGAHLDARRMVGSRIVVEPPLYQGVTVVARLRSSRNAAPADVEAAAVRNLVAYLHPLSGGPDGDGWPFGRPLNLGEVFAALQAVPGLEYVEDVQLFGADPVTGERSGRTQRLDIGPNALLFSYQHQALARSV